MCRMLIFKGDKIFFKKLLDALLKASYGDAFYENKQHKDGWGGIIINGKREFFIKSLYPIYSDEQINFLRNLDGYLYGLIHVRLSAPNEPSMYINNSHPYIIHGENEIVYLAHNGWIDKEKIGKDFKINIENRNDTEVFSLFLEKLEGNFLNRLEYGIDYIKENALLGSLNLMCLIENINGNIKYCYYSKFKNPSLYISLYKYDDGYNFSVMSSTVAYEMGFIDLKGNIKNINLEMVKEDIIFIK